MFGTGKCKFSINGSLGPFWKASEKSGICSRFALAPPKILGAWVDIAIGIQEGTLHCAVSWSSCGFCSQSTRPTCWQVLLELGTPIWPPFHPFNTKKNAKKRHLNVCLRCHFITPLRDGCYFSCLAIAFPVFEVTMEVATLLVPPGWSWRHARVDVLSKGIFVHHDPFSGTQEMRKKVTNQNKSSDASWVDMDRNLGDQSSLVTIFGKLFIWGVF